MIKYIIEIAEKRRHTIPLKKVEYFSSDLYLNEKDTPKKSIFLFFLS